ncbi:MAG: glycoside hydrolase family 13 protein [Oscillospiraceae bacterium]|nr:glycoside hydrolase family 13 protein [Oscillospiraceae bacterium]
MTIDTPECFSLSDSRCKEPYGAAPSGSKVRFTLRPPRQEGFTKAFLIARWEFEGDWELKLTLPWVGLEGDRDLFSGFLSVGEHPGLIWYSLRLERADGTGEDTGVFQLTVYDRGETVPAWFGEGVCYQIFPDRFRRLSVPDPTGMVGGRTVHQDWAEDPVYLPNEHGEIRNRDFFGGSLAGIIEKLPYLDSLGVETIYLCPIFEAAENHRYGAADYEKIDPMLGTREDFVRLCGEAHKRGMHIMLDGVFNHTGFVSKYFNGDGFYPGPGAGQSQSSPYYDWFCFQHWPDQYTSWWGIYSMPTTNKENKAWLEYITGENGIIRSWLRAGADGWRLDVADELPDFVVHAIHAAARAEKPDAVIIGEVWEDASNKIAYDVRRRHVLGGHCDGVMNYPLRTALLDYLLGGDGANFRNGMEALRQNYPKWAFHSCMNALGTHDTLRVLTFLGVESDHKGDTSRDWRFAHRLNPYEREMAESRLRLGSLLLYAFPGAPTLYYGDEAGMEGFEDPFNRRTFPWGHEDPGLVDWFSRLGQLRKRSSALRRGDLSWLTCTGSIVSFTRETEGETLIVAANAGWEYQQTALPDGTVFALAPLEGCILRENGEVLLSTLA